MGVTPHPSRSESSDLGLKRAAAVPIVELRTTPPPHPQVPYLSGAAGPGTPSAVCSEGRPPGLAGCSRLRLWAAEQREISGQSQPLCEAFCRQQTPCMFVSPPQSPIWKC